MSTTTAEAQNQLDLVNDILGKFTKSTQALLERQHKELKGDHESALTAVNQRLDAVAPTIAALQQKQKELTDIVADIETGRMSGKPRPAGTSDLKTSDRTIGHRVTRSGEYAMFCKSSQRNQMAKLTVAVACLFSGIKRVPKDLVDRIAQAAREGKAIDFDDTTAGTGVNPQYIPGVVEFPKVMPLIRQLCPALATSETNLIRLDREAQELPLAARVTAISNIGDTTIEVDNVTGFQTSTNWNTIYLDNGSDPVETNAVSSISANADGSGVLTVTATSIALAVGDRVYAQRWGITPEGSLAPRSAEELEDYEVPVCELSSLVRANALKLDDIVYAEQYIERRLLNRVARMEDLHCFYGPGGTNPSRIKGIFADSAVDESTRAGGTTYIDHIVDCIYEVWDRDYMPTTTVLSLAVHKSLLKSKDSTGRYLFWQNLESGSPMQLHVTKLYGHRQLNPTHGIIGDFQMGCTIFDREDATVEIGYNNDDFARRKKSILAHERIAFAIEQPGALQRAVF